MNEYHKALDAFETACKLDPSNEHAIEGAKNTRNAIQSVNSNRGND